MHSTFPAHPSISFCLPLPCLPVCVRLLSISHSVCLSAEMSLSFVTRLCSDWMVRPFCVRLTRLSRWRHPFIPAVQQSVPHCNPSLHPKHRCKGTGYFSCVHVHAVLVYTLTKKKKKYTEHTQLLCVHKLIFEQTHTALILSPPFVAYKNADCFWLVFFLIWTHFLKKTHGQIQDNNLGSK